VSDALPAQTFSPSGSYEGALDRACQIWGVQKEYWDIFGRHHIAPPDVQATILRSLGIAVGSIESIDSAVEARLWNNWCLPVSPTLVIRLSDGVLPVQIPEGGECNELHAHFTWEDGTSDSIRAAPASLEPAGWAEIRGRRFNRLRLPLPPAATLGYHTLRVNCGGNSTESRLILCPDRAFKPEFLERGGKTAGIAVSLYGLRSGRNWGCGDFTDLEQFAQWAEAELKVSFVALNPLHSIPNRQPYNTSPYLPNCSFYRNPIYLDVERIEDVQSCALAQRLLESEKIQLRFAELRASQYVEYEKIWKLKLRFLKLGFREFLRNNPAGSARRLDFDEYLAREGDLLGGFAVYQALDEALHKKDRNLWIWPDWPEPYRDPESADVADFATANKRLVLFYKWVQWQVDVQLEAAQKFAKECGLPIGLYHDLALATDRCGSDLWGHRHFYVAGCRVGSPPDDFSPQGQDWAFPPPNSVRHHDSGYRLFIDSIRKNCSHGGALRIDHVMRFFRLFWIPDGKSAAEGVYVLDNSEDLLRILALESVRQQVLVVGEDLGTVEPYIREALRRYGILSYRLLYFEKNPDGSFRRPEQYPRQALVSVSTHDLPTLAGFWLHRDIEARRAAGVLPDEASYQDQMRARLEEKQRMLDVMSGVGLLPDWFPRAASEVPDFAGELHNAAVGFLASTPSELMVLNQEDLFKDSDQQNLPGTTDQYPNWRHKMRYDLDELRTDADAQACASMFRTWLERTGRLNQTGRP
jgi:4-alpha-glucanotransferase